MFLVVGSGSLDAQSEPRFRYMPELELVHIDEKGRSRPCTVDNEIGLALRLSTAGVSAWISAKFVDPSTEELFQHHLRDLTMLRPMEHQERVRDDLGFATGVDKSKRALVLSRLHHLKRHDSLFEVSNVIGLIQKDNCYLGQLEMRWGKDGRVLHAKRSQQHAGPLLENGFPSMATIELVQTSTDKRTNSSQMVRIVLVYPASREEAARIRVHLVGDLRRQTGGRVQTRRVHVVSEFTRGGGIKIWTSIGEKNPFISWEEAITYKHEHDWQNAGSGSQTGSHKWERPFHPYSPKNRGVRPIPMVALLKIPAKWNAGGYSGAALRGKNVKVKHGRWALTNKDFLISGGIWQFDKKGELVVSSPLGVINAKKVLAWFKAQFAAAKSDPTEVASLRDCLEVILNWATDMPQLPRSGPGKSPASVSKFLSAK